MVVYQPTIANTAIGGVMVLTPPVHHDVRGEIVTIHDILAWPTTLPPFVQDKLSKSYRCALRGLHGDFRTTKLISCLTGRVYVVVVDARRQSPTYGQWLDFTMTDVDRRQLVVPPGVFNGHYCLSDDCLLWYKLDEFYGGPQQQQTIAWNDPNLDICWPTTCPILSERDRHGVNLSEIVYDGEPA